MAIKGPFLLNERTVKYVLTRTSPGVFLLYTLQAGPPRYAGSSEDDIRAKILKWVGRSYRFFKFDYCPSAEAAFYQLCELYHTHKKTLDNARHPEALAGSSWRCPLCEASEKRESR
jgi:hypothetical protein